MAKDEEIILQEDAESFHKRMKLWDKKLYHLNDEMLYYVIMRASSILEHRSSDEQLTKV